MNTVTLIEGDGVGPEIIEAVVGVIEAAGVEIRWDEQLAGAKALDQHGVILPQNTLESLKRTGVALKGPMKTPLEKGVRSVNGALRTELDLYANVRPIKSYRGVSALLDDIDLIVIRENTEDLFAGIEHMVGDDAAESVKITTRKASERICRFAFWYAQNAGRKKVTAVHKANIMKMTDGLFLEAARKVAEEYPDFEYEESVVDTTALQLVSNPWQYEVMVMPNLYGDILADLCAGLVGGLGLVPGVSLGDDMAVFEPAHDSMDEEAGRNVANPSAMIMASVLMLGYIGESEAARKIEAALAHLVEEGQKVTPDIGGSAGTREMARALAERLG